jgi:radical SAM protein with 4Fe4S-binding SPASM domain
VKLLDVDLTIKEQQKFYDDFNAISDTINIDTLMNWGGSDSLGRDFMLGEKSDKFINSVSTIKTDRQVCSAPFKSLAINFNGQVSVCCVDWKLETLVGDVSKIPLKDIWNGEALKEFRLAHLNGNRKSLSACADCRYYLGFSNFEDLDDVAGEIIERLEE